MSIALIILFTSKYSVATIESTTQGPPEATVTHYTTIRTFMTQEIISSLQASYFSRDDQALHGFSKYFEKASGEEREHGMKLMEYQVKRGGKVVFQDIAKPTTMEWGTALDAMEAALELEKTVGYPIL